MRTFVTCTYESAKVAAFHFECMSGNFSIKIRKLVWPRIVIYFKYELKTLKTLDEIGEILLNLTNSKDNIKGVYNSIDFLLFLGVKKA